MLIDRLPGRTGRRRGAAAFVLWIGALAVAAAFAGVDEDRRAITAMLTDFLANVGDIAVHERFWADDLVYTSSGGARFGKQDILEGMRAAPPRDSDAPPAIYTGRDVDIRVYGDSAVLAFRLVATNGGDAPEEFFNTGTLVRRDGRWQVVAWQATRIPDVDTARD